jgi:hypothetical protein
VRGERESVRNGERENVKETNRQKERRKINGENETLTKIRNREDRSKDGEGDKESEEQR